MSAEQQTFAIATGLGIGEETKGVTVQWLTRQLHAHTNLRSGGCQGGAHIQMENGQEQMFSHYGAGTFEGASTYLSHMVINPVDIFEEAIELEKKGIVDPFRLMTIDSQCLTITPYHGAMSRFREVMRGEQKKGTVGMGVGDAVRDSNSTELSIRTGEFIGSRENLEWKVEAIRKHKLQQAREIFDTLTTRLPDQAQAELEILYNRRLVNATVDSFIALGKLVRIVKPIYLDELLSRGGVIVNETSHGALLHPTRGFVPHVTQIDPTAQDVMTTLKQYNYGGKILRLGVSRCYMTRHGAGPLVSFSKELSQSIQETHNNQPHDNEWIGEFRNGHYDTVAMRYALDISGGIKSFDGLSISYLDVLDNRDEWQVCEAYIYDGNYPNVGNFFVIENGIITGIKVREDTHDEAQLQYQTQLTTLLQNCHPILQTLTPTKTQSLEEIFIDFVENRFGLPVILTGYGPTASNRKLYSKYVSIF